jgi:predicted permease
MLRTLMSRIVSTIRRQRVEREFDEELQSHLQMLTERFIRRGMEPGEAYYAARRQFGHVTQMKEELHERQSLPRLDVIVRDFRHGARQLRKARGFTASAAFTLALGIGASTAIFAVLDAVVLKPLPFAAPDRLMAVSSLEHRAGAPVRINRDLSYPNFLDFRARNQVFEHLVSYRQSRFTLTDTLPAIQVAGQIVSWDLFPCLGVQPKLGRGFLPEEEKPATRTVVLSHALWTSRFGADPEIAGKKIHIDGRLYTVAGVAPARFRFPVDTSDVQLWTTISDDATVSEFTPLIEQRGARVITVVGRLRPGITPEQAQAQMDQIAAALAKDYPDENKNIAATSIEPEMERLVGHTRQPVWILFGAVTLVLLIACANVANLLLARSADRAREFALRTALGASRAALVWQMLAESLILGALGAAGGVLLTQAAVRFVLPLAGEDLPIPRVFDTGVDLRVLAFSIAAALLTAVLFSLAPAVQLLRVELTGALKAGAANIALGQPRLRSALVIGQITIGLILLAGAELLMVSFLNLAGRDTGFRADHLLTFDIGLSSTRYTNAGEVAFCARLLEKLKAIPGVHSAATGMPLPLEGHQMSVSFDIEERPAAPPDRPHSDIAIVTPGYFGTMRIPVLRGRDFSDRDDANAPRVLVVNEAFARKFFPGEDGIGKRVVSGATNGKEGTPTREIVGIVGNALQAPWGADPDPIYYFPYRQLSWGIGTIILRTDLPPLELQSAAQAALASLDREAPMYRVRTGEERSAMAFALQRFLMVLAASFAGIAMALTIVGLHGLLSYAVAKRRREIGLRMALGAARREVLGLVLRQAGGLVVVGLILGLAGAAVVQRSLASMLFGIRPGDPAFILIAGGLVVVAGLAAAYAPAVRAASVDPAQALRSE